MFVEGRAGRRAPVAGTGLYVWRLVDPTDVRERFPLLTEDQINLAQAYARSFPGEITFFREVENL